jgi:hypothetical protein
MTVSKIHAHPLDNTSQCGRLRLTEKRSKYSRAERDIGPRLVGWPFQSAVFRGTESLESVQTIQPYSTLSPRGPVIIAREEPNTVQRLEV